MSSDKDSVYHQFDPFSFYNHHELNNQPSLQFFSTDDDNPSSMYNHRSTPPQQRRRRHQFDPSLHTSFAEYLHGSMDYNTLSRAFDLSCSSNSEVISSSVDDHNSKKQSGLTDGARVSGSNHSTVNSSVSSSSNEAEAVENVEEEDSAQCKKDKKPVGREDQGEDGKSNKNENKPKKEKKPRAPRFAFLTKSDVDHLEDGYRWRKYGQKAVKNSPYPRSYYRCTTQKCIVKKRVERSFQDPSIVVTTYEGQHNHHAPATLRSNAAAVLSSSSFFPSSASTGPSNLPHELLVQLLPVNNQGDYYSSMHQSHLTPNQQQQQFQFHEYGLLQNLLPSFSHEDDH